MWIGFFQPGQHLNIMKLQKFCKSDHLLWLRAVKIFIKDVIVIKNPLFLQILCKTLQISQKILSFISILNKRYLVYVFISSLEKRKWFIFNCAKIRPISLCFSGVKVVSSIYSSIKINLEPKHSQEKREQLPQPIS